MAVNVYGLVAVIIFYLIILAVGIYAGRKKKSTVSNESEEAMLAGRNIGLALGIFTVTATWCGGGYINGTAESVFSAIKGDGSGLVWCQAPLAYSSSLVVNGIVFAKKMREAGYVTMLDPLQKKLGNVMGGLLFIPALCGDIFWTAAILAALGSTLAVIIDLELWIAVLISACISLLYTVLGGLYSVAFTDVPQLACLAVGLVVAVPFALTNSNVEPILKTASQPIGSVNFNQNHTAGSLSVGWLGNLDASSSGLYIDTFMLLVLGGIPWQAYYQRALATQNIKDSRTLSIVGGVLCFLLGIPPALLGAAGYSTDWNATDYKGEIPPNPQLILPLVLQYLTPTPVAFIGLGAVSAAVMSSTDSSMLSCSTMFARNIYKLVLRPKASEREVVWVMRAGIIIFGAIATILAITINSIYALFVLCADLVYVILFSQLMCVVFVPWTNIFGSATAYLVTLTLRLLVGEPLISLPTVIEFPWFDEETNTQYFPVKTLIMIIGLIITLVVSYITNHLMETGRLNVNLEKLVMYDLKEPSSHNVIDTTSNELKADHGGKEYAYNNPAMDDESI